MQTPSKHQHETRDWAMIWIINGCDRLDFSEDLEYLNENNFQEPL